MSNQTSKWERCPYWDCGWCYASDSDHNACPGTQNCDYYKDVICTDKDEEIDDGK